jgi:flagellar biogenesis protein FliO
MFEWADVPQPNPTDTEVAPEAKEPKPSATPLELADETRGPSITKVVVALFVIGVLIAVLALATKKLRNIRGGASLVHGEGVKVLAKYPVAKGNMVLVLEVLDEVLVVSQNPSGDLALLHHMPQERAEQLRQSEVFAPDGVSTGFFDGLLKRRKSERARRATHSFVRDYSDDVDDYAGTLDDLAQSLESNARAGALRETPPSLAKITPLFGESHNDFAAHDSKAEPIDFQELLARRAAHKRYGSGASPLPTGGSRDEKDTVSLQTGTGRMDISDVTQQVRERIRSLGRL